MQIYLSATWVILSITETKIHNLSAVWNPQYLLKYVYFADFIHQALSK